MNNFFNPKRFAKLFVKQTAEHYRTYLMSIGVLAGVMLLGGSFLFFVIPGPVDSGFQTALFVTLMLIAGTIFTSNIFSDLGTRSKAIPSLTLPASTFEKYLVAWLYTYPIFIIIYTGIFYLALIILSSMKHWDNQSFRFLSLMQGEMYMLLVLYSVLHALSFLGAIFFEKLHFIKTGFIFFIGYALIVFINTLALRSLTGQDVTAALPFGYLNFTSGGNYYSLAASAQASAWIIWYMILAAILIWLAAYYKLKEKQV